MTTDKRVNEELIADAQAFRGSSDQYAEFITELADALEAATLEQDTATEPKNLSIMNGWLVELVGKHTCGTGPDGHYGAHEPGCGYEPHLNLADLEGWPGAEHDAATAALKREAAVLELRKRYGQSNGTQTWIEFHGDPHFIVNQVLAALDGAPEPEVKP